MSTRNDARNDLRTDEHVYIVQRGLGRERRPLFCIIRHIPAKGKGFFVGEADFRCCDVWREVFGVSEQGCYYTQFYDDPEHLRCHGCGLTFAKYYLRSGMLLQIENIPPDYKVPRSH